MLIFYLAFIAVELVAILHLMKFARPKGSYTRKSDFALSLQVYLSNKEFLFTEMI
jgi:hypothetical protein